MPFEESNSSSKYNLLFQSHCFFEPSIAVVSYSDKDKVYQGSVQGIVSGHSLCILPVYASGGVVPPQFACLVSPTQPSLPFQIPEFSKCAFNRRAISFLKSICGYFKMCTGGCREQKCLSRWQTTLTLSISKLLQVIFKKMLFQ